MDLLKAVSESFVLQDKMNTIVNPNWRTANYPWYRAAWIEAAELMDHANYKWWKNLGADGDRDQILLELVDIYHFLVSDMIVHKVPPGGVITSYIRCKSIKPNDKEDQLREVESFAQTCLETFAVLPLDFCRIVATFGFTLEEILQWYIAKNTLNIFRQDNGYRDGSYIKTWSGREDNEFLADYVKENKELDYNSVYAFLSTTYQKVKNNEAV